MLLLQADGSEASKSSSWHSKRRRSVTPSDDSWERRDRKRGRYDDDGTTVTVLCSQSLLDDLAHVDWCCIN